MILEPQEFEALARRAAEYAVQLIGNGSSPYLTADEAADYMRCARQRVYDLCSNGSLRRYRDGTRLLLRRDEIDQMLASNG